MASQFKTAFEVDTGSDIDRISEKELLRMGNKKGIKMETKQGKTKTRNKFGLIREKLNWDFFKNQSLSTNC